MQLTFQFSQPPPIVWDWLTDPRKRNLYSPGVTWSTAAKARGRSGKGARNHCAHGKDEVSVETILDWHPFDYYTFENIVHAGHESWMDFSNTYTFEALPEGQGTRVHSCMKLKKQTLLGRFTTGTGLLKMVMGKMLQPTMDRMEELMRQAVDQQGTGMESSPVASIPAEAS